MHHSLTSQFTTTFIDNYINRFLDGVNAPIYNYMCGDDFMSDEDFSSALFLSHEGAKKYTAILIDRLIKDKVMNVKKLQTGGNSRVLLIFFDYVLGLSNLSFKMAV